MSKDKPLPGQKPLFPHLKTSSKPVMLPFIPSFTPVQFCEAPTLEAQDVPRIQSQMASVKELMKDGVWRTLDEIQDMVGGSTPALSARLRDLRKPEHGSWIVERRRRDDPKRGLFEYKCTPPRREAKP